MGKLALRGGGPRSARPTELARPGEMWAAVPKACRASGLLVLVDGLRTRLPKEGMAETLSEGNEVKLWQVTGGRRAVSSSAFDEPMDSVCSAVWDDEHSG